MDIPTEIAAIEKAGAARAAEILPTVEHYEKDLITFITEHQGLAIQFLVIVSVPVALLAFMIGRHFH
jgi:hypothetical protein